MYNNINSNHQLIPRAQNYVLDRKLLTVHSYDRDICKWPNANHFEIKLPQALKNVQSLRLVEICLPVNYYNFSNDLQNTKFRLQDASSLLHSPTKAWDISIQDGFYTPDDLAAELKNQIILTTQDPCYNVFWDSVGQKIYFGNGQRKNFSLLFDEKIEYDLSCNFENVFDRYSQWGFPAYLGYKKKKYTSIPGPKYFNYRDPSYIFVGDNGSYVKPEDDTICIFGENTIYMEVDKYNSMDEIDPFPDSNCKLDKNYMCCPPPIDKVNYNGRVNSAFAKIPVICVPYCQMFDSRNGFIQNISHYEPPIERIEKLKFKFRTHDGRLIQFQCMPLNFTIEFNCLKDEIPRNYTVRVPPLYSL